MALKRNLAWMGVGQGVSFLLQVAGSVVLARLLSPHEMGIYVFASALMGLLGVIQAFGMGSFIIREKELIRDEVATAFTIHAAVSLALSVLAIGIGLLAGRFFQDPGVGQVLVVLALMPFLGIFELLPSAHLERAGRFKALVGVAMVRNLTATVCTITAALLHMSYLSFAIGQAIGAVSGLVVLNVIGREHVQLRFSRQGWRRLLRFGGDMLAISGLNVLSIRLEDLILGRILGLTALGLFGRCTNVFGLFWENLHLVIGRVLFVDLAQRKREGQSLRESYLLICELTTATLWPAFAGLAIMSRPIFQTVYGAKWVGAAIPFSLIAISGVIQVSVTMTWEIFTISGESRRQARLEAILTAFRLAAFVGACFVSLSAAAGTRVLDSAFGMILYRPHLERMTDTKFADFVPIYLRSGLLTVLAVAPAGLLTIYTHAAADLPLLQMIGAIMAGIALWLAGLTGLKHPLMAEILAAKRRVLAPRTAVP